MQEVAREMLTVKEVGIITGLGRNKSYELLNSNQFHVLKFGSKLLVHREVLERYLQGDCEKKIKW